MAPFRLLQAGVEDNEIRPRCGRAVAVHVPAVQMIQQRRAIGYVCERVAEARSLQRLGRLQTMLRVVVRHDDDRRPHRVAGARRHRKLVAAALQPQHRLVQLGERHGLHQIGVGAEVVAVGDVQAGLGSREDDDRDLPQRRPEVDLPERVETRHVGHVEVEQDQVGAGRRAGIGELTAPPEIVQQLLAVLHEAQLVPEPRLLQRLLGQQAILGIVVRHQYQDRLGVWRGAHRALTGAADGAASP